MSIKKEEFEFYESSEELPIKKFQKFNKLMMMASDVGSSFADYSNRINRVRQFIQSELPKEANKELINLKQALFNGLNEMDPSNEALAILVKSINGKPVSTNTESEIESVIKRLDAAGFTKKAKDEKISEVKKK